MQNDAKVFVILIPGFPRDESDSNCLPAQQAFVRNLSKQYSSLQIIIFSFQYPFKKGEYNWYNNKVIAFGGQNRGGIARLFLWRKVRQRFNQLKKKHAIAGIVSFWCGECGRLGKKLAHENGILHYCWIMGQDAKKENRYVIKIKPAAGELIAISDFARDEFERNHGTRPASVIPLGIDPGEFTGEPVTRDIDVLAAGSLIPLKQYEIFLKVVDQLREKNPGIKAMLAGEGPERKKLESLIHSLGLTNHVLLCGELPHPELLQYMQRAKVFLHTSEYEGFGMVCTEALYAGAAVISFTRPMERAIPNWHQAFTTNEMAGLANKILHSTQAVKPELPFPVNETVLQIGNLFSL